MKGGTKKQVASLKMPKMRSTLHTKLEEIDGAGDLEHGDEVTLYAKGKVTELSTRDNYDNGGKSTTCIIDLSDIAVVDKDLRKSKPPAKPDEGAGGLSDMMAGM